MKHKRFMFILKFASFAVVSLFAIAPQVFANIESDITVSDIVTLVEEFADEGQFTNESAKRALTMHLTAVNHFEQQEETGKVVEHMNSFKLLLNHQRDNELISENAYEALLEGTNALIRTWDRLMIVQGGQANAVIVYSDDVVPGKDAHHWQRWGDGTAERQFDIVRSGNASLLLDDTQVGGVHQVFDAVTGTITANAYYYTPELSEGTLQIGLHLKNADGVNVLSTFTSPALLSVSVGEWSPLTLALEVPGMVNQHEVESIQVVARVRDGQDAQVYIDDFSVRHTNENGEERTLNENTGMENDSDHPAYVLLEYVEKSTGVELPLVTENMLRNEEEFADYNRIYIGKDESEMDEQMIEAMSELNDDGFVIQTKNNQMTIAGPTDLGTEFGLFEFLERYVGISWLMPGEDGEYVPELSDISVPRELIRKEPAAISRRYFAMNFPALSEWSKRNKLHDHIQFHHNLNHLFDPEVFTDHPEYYPNGEVPPAGTHSWQPCLNDETAAAAIDRIIEYFNENPDASSYSLGVNDGRNYYCEADPEHPDYPGELNSVGAVNMSNLYYPWVNQIAEGVTAVHPDKYFGLLAYSNVYDPPTNVELHPQVVPYITDDRMSWSDTDMGDIGRQHTKNWEQVATNLGWYEYLYGTRYNLPRIYLQRMADNYQYAQEHHVFAHVAELAPNFGGEGPKSWLSAKLQWDPNQDISILLDEWYTKAVGEEAAPYLQEYFEHWEHFWTVRIFETDWYQEWASNPNRSNYLNFNSKKYLTAVTIEDVTESRRLLEKVIDLAGSEKQQVRAELFLQSFEFYEASILSYAVSDDVETPANEQEAVEMLDYIKQSLEMAEKRAILLEEYTSSSAHPILALHRSKRLGEWNGVQLLLFNALWDYVESEPAGGPVGPLVDQFLSELPEQIRLQFLYDAPDLENLSAMAVKTDASKESILQSLDFNTGPWVDAVPFNEFLIMNTTATFPPVETKVYLLWDDENLYVGYENFDDDPSQMIVSDEAPNGWWSSGADDSVETFVTDDIEKTFLGFFTNPKAVKFTRQDQTVEYEASAQIGSDRWNVIQVIPFDAIDVDPTETDTLMALFFRNYRGNSFYLGWGGGAPWQPVDLKPVHLVEESLTENHSFESGDVNASNWRVWNNFDHGTVERTEEAAYSAQASLKMDGVEQGGVHQIFDAVQGDVLARLQYFVPESSEGTLQIGMHFKDAGGSNLSSIFSNPVTLSDSKGMWSSIELTTEIPEYINKNEVKQVQVVVRVMNGENTLVYVDDVGVYMK